MKYVAFIALITFIAIGIFGFAGFGLNFDSAFMNCLHSIMGGHMDCMGSFQMGIMHAQIYQSFSLGLTIGLILALIMLMSTSAVFASPKFLKFISGNISSLVLPKKRNWQSLHISQNPLL